MTFLRYSSITSDNAMQRTRQSAAVLAFLAFAPLAGAAPASQGGPLLAAAATQVLPANGHHSKVALGESIVKLVREGVIERRKFYAVYAQRGGVTEELADLLNKQSPKPILLTRGNAGLYVNVLWPIGLTNRMAANQASPLNGASRHRYASTGGWTLGRNASGGDYFNSLSIVNLNASQEALVVAIARNSFRPCCNNSAFFQDCNHGSALLGLLALGASQGLSEEDLYREALAFNVAWFPDNYLHTALYFKAVKGIEWRDVDARTAMGAAFSSANGWRANVVGELEVRGFLPRQAGPDCSA